jgi:hypothetical protein
MRFTRVLILSLLVALAKGCVPSLAVAQDPLWSHIKINGADVQQPKYPLFGCTLYGAGACGSGGGGGGGTPGGSNGNPQINAGGSFGAALNVLYSQSGDTIASVESACSAACSYIVTQPQTITLSGNHAMSPNVHVLFLAAGTWTITGGAFVLSNVLIDAASTKTQHIVYSSGATATGATNAQLGALPFEWFGAVADGATDNQTAMQGCINFIAGNGGCLAGIGTYNFSGTLSLTVGSTNIYGADEQLTILQSTAASTADVIDILGTNTSVNVVANWVHRLTVQKSVTGTGTSACIKMNYAVFANIAFVNGKNCMDSFYLHAAYATTLENTTGFSVNSASSSIYHMDSSDGLGENSIELEHTSAVCAGTGVGKAYNISGSAVNDIDSDQAGAGNACAYNLWINYTGSGASDSQSDSKWTHATFDAAAVSSVYVNGYTFTGQVTSSLLIANSYLEGGSPVVDVENSVGIILADNMIGGTSVTSPQVVKFVGSNSNTMSGNALLSIASTSNTINGIELDSSSFNSITANVLAGLTAGSLISIGTSSNYNSITANSLNGTATNGVFAASGTVGNAGCETTVVNPSGITTPFAGVSCSTSGGSSTPPIFGVQDAWLALENGGLTLINSGADWINSMTCVGTTWVGGALTFDGSTSYCSSSIAANTSFTSATPFTVMFTVNASSTAACTYIGNLQGGSASPGFGVTTSDGHSLSIYLISNAGTGNYANGLTASVVTAGTPVRLAIVFAGKNTSTWTLYANGVPVTISPNINALTGSTASTSPVTMGNQGGAGGTQFYAGKGPKPVIVARALTSTEILADYAASATQP